MDIYVDVGHNATCGVWGAKRVYMKKNHHRKKSGTPISTTKCGVDTVARTRRSAVNMVASIKKLGRDLI